MQDFEVQQLYSLEADLLRQAYVMRRGTDRQAADDYIIVEQCQFEDCK